MSPEDAEREMAAFDAHTRARMMELADDLQLALARKELGLRRTITGRVLRWAWHEGSSDARRVYACISSAREALPVKYDTIWLHRRLGSLLCERLYRKHGPRFLEHALLVGTARPEPGSRRLIDSLAVLRNPLLPSMLLPGVHHGPWPSIYRSDP